MEVSKVSLSLISAVLPLGVGFGHIPIPDQVPWWVAMLIASLGPGCVGFLSFGGKAIVQITAAYFKQIFEAKRAKGKKLLEDSDRSNDAEGDKLINEANAALAAANKAEELIKQMSNNNKGE